MSRKALPCKACVEHPKGTCFAARSDYFRAARRHNNNDIISGCRKKPEAYFDSLKDTRKGVFLCGQTEKPPGGAPGGLYESGF